MIDLTIEKAIEKDPLIYYYLDEIYRYDKEITLEAVKRCGALLKYTSDELKKDYDVVFAALLNSSDAMQYVSPEFHYDERCMKAINSHPIYGYTEDNRYIIKEGIPFEE